MDIIDEHNMNEITSRLSEQVMKDAIRITLHAHQEMVAEAITMDEIRDVLANAVVLENYPEHKRGSCCLVCQKTYKGRFIHVVCTASTEVAIIITVYEPKPPKWKTPFQRG